MKTLNIPTAEEYLITNAQVYTEDFNYEEMVGKDDVFDTKETITSVMIEFAKLHVEAALKEASENAKLKGFYYDRWEDSENYNKYKDNWDLRTDGDGIPYGVDVYEVNKESILNAYPLSNIK